MSKKLTIWAMATLVATPAVAQESAVFNTADNAEDAVAAVEDSVRDDFRDSRRVGTGSGFRQLGWRGSVSASASATSGNTDTFDAGIGARFGYGGQDWDHDFTLSYNYGEENDIRSANRFLGAYDASRYFTDRFMVMAISAIPMMILARMSRISLSVPVLVTIS